MEELELELYREQRNYDLPLSQYAETQIPSTQSLLQPFQHQTFSQEPQDNSSSVFLSNNFPNNYDLSASCPMQALVYPFGNWHMQQPSTPQFEEDLERENNYYNPQSYFTTDDRAAAYLPEVNYPTGPCGSYGHNSGTVPENPQFVEYPPIYMSERETQDSGQQEALDIKPQISFSPLEGGDFTSHDGLPMPSSEAQPSYSMPPSMPPSESSEDGGRTRETTAVEIELDDHGNDEPYAKLIYRALMSVPGRSMVLQEIYQWFRANTTKESSDTKGWMNSIRHNLSMNAAFRKTERQLSSDETNGCARWTWVLEDFALKGGVKPTTRYRKGAAKKVPRSSAPRGRNAARKSVLQRHRQEERSDRSRIRHIPQQYQPFTLSNNNIPTLSSYQLSARESAHPSPHQIQRYKTTFPVPKTRNAIRDTLRLRRGTGY